jgi:16S rRNA (guanine527-N7)-methyltransferase
MKNYTTLLTRGIAKLGLNFDENQIDKLLAYLHLLDKWNHHYNLSAIRDIEQMVTHHILDSLAVSPYLSDCERVLDVGTGAGLPGFVLAVCYPQHHFVLLDGNGKKIRFLVQAKHELKISNIEPVQARAENYQTTDCFNGIISRAVGSINELIDNTKHLLCPHGHWYAMKGNYPEAELKGLTYPHRVERLDVPQLEGSRHLVIIED